QTVAGHDAVRLQQEECQQRALLLPTKIEHQPVRSHLERAQETELMTDPDDATPGIARTRRRRRPLGAAPSPGTARLPTTERQLVLRFAGDYERRCARHMKGERRLILPLAADPQRHRRVRDA